MRTVLAALGAAAALALCTMPASGADASATPPTVHVSGNQLVTADGTPVQLRGLNRSGTEYACVQGWGIFDGPSDGASIQAMKTWHPDIVRVPLNEDCWLGINGVAPAYSGVNYRTAITGYVRRLEAHGLLVDLELHWNAPGSTLATGQQVMPDAAHSPTFWRGVADRFKNDHDVLFELYNEPHDVSWQCWLDGCVTSGGWRAAGMQQLLDAVRSTGATNVVLTGGLGWSSDLSAWLAHEPDDPAGQLAAAFHTYNFSGCNDRTCWNSTVARVAKTVPVVMTEFGENDCGGSYVAPLMSWADADGISYLAWTWDTWDCSSGPALITDYDGTPTAYGAAVRAHYLAAA